MPYKMHFYIDGGCRNNGYSNAIGAAACIWMPKYGAGTTYERRLSNWPKMATSQRAELHAVCLALEAAWKRFMNLDGNPYLKLRIYTDSRYVVGCMTQWKEKWLDTGFYNVRGFKVSNCDLIKKAYNWHEKLARKGWVEYVWIPREENQAADDAVNEILDEME